MDARKQMRRRLLTLLLVASLSQATTITGVGYGENNIESEKDALSDLSNNISVEVRSSFKSYKAVINKKLKKHEESSINHNKKVSLLHRRCIAR